MSTLAIDNFKPSAGGTSFGIEGIAKAWLVFDQNTSNTIEDSYNISSVTDVAAGKADVYLNNNHSSTAYSPFGYTFRGNAPNISSTAGGPLKDTTNQGSGNFLHYTYGSNAGSESDVEWAAVTFGDLA